jgi:hypothetical protein
MKKVVLFVCVFLFAASLAFAAGPKSYQVTGPVLDVKDDVITVQKGKDRWEIAKDKSTKVTGDVKVGQKVTIQYQMKATEIEAKAAPVKPAAKEAPKKK